MKVLLLPADQSGCKYYRMSEPAQAIREGGDDIELEIDHGLDVDGESRNGETVLNTVDPRGADVVVFQRPTNMVMLQAMRMLQDKGVACVVEIDDLMHGVSTAHAGHKAIVKDQAADRVTAMAREADLVTCTTPALAREYARHGRVEVIPNAIPRRIAELPPAYDRRPDMVTVGWTGSVFTHPHDLQVMGTGVRTALDRTRDKSRFAIMGQAIGARERLSLPTDPIEIPWVHSVDEYLAKIGEEFDVGLAPLRDDRFNRAKSWLKPLEYAARGVYPIRSKIDEYNTLGVGRAPKSPKDWAQWITRAVENPEARQEFAMLEREYVMNAHLTEHTAPRWVQAWQRALEYRSRA